MDINLDVPFKKSSEETFEIAKGALSDPVFTRLLSSDPQIDEENKRIDFKEKKFSGFMVVENREEGCCVNLQIKLPLLLRPLKEKIKDEITKRLEKYSNES